MQKKRAQNERNKETETKNGGGGRSKRTIEPSSLLRSSSEGRELGAALLEVDGASVLGHDGGHVHWVIASRRPLPPEVHHRHEERHEQHQVVERVPLPDARVRPGSERQEIALERHVLPARLGEEPLRVERLGVREPLERRLVHRREHDGALGHRVPLRQLERLAGDVRDQRRRRPVPDHLPRHRLRVPHPLDLLRRDGLAGLRRPRRGDLGAHAVEHLRRVLHPVVDEALGLAAGAHPRLALPRALPERAHQPRHALPGSPEREPWKVHGHRHEPDVEEVVVPLEPPPRFLGEVGAGEHRLRGLEVHVAAGHPYGERPPAVGGAPVEPAAEVGEDDALLEGGVGGEGTRGEVGGDAAAEVLVVLAEHVDEVVVAEELLAERVADEVERVGADVGEDAVGELRVADEDDEPPHEEVGGEPGAGLLGARRLRVPERRRVADHVGDAAEEGDDEGRAGEWTLLAVVGQLLHQEVERHRRRHERRRRADVEDPGQQRGLRRHCSASFPPTAVALAAAAAGLGLSSPFDERGWYSKEEYLCCHGDSSAGTGRGGKVGAGICGQRLAGKGKGGGLFAWLARPWRIGRWMGWPGREVEGTRRTTTRRGRARNFFHGRNGTERGSGREAKAIPG
ncbi:hypothetical protein HU200_027778 [Digitaria exilis]|uniref:Uncharacterized protein n=1 Tax=Digitaria exilis TaxID=1010633 RepID=A0A835EUF6_9POAL|nr:hypothetical protein HU200_027778 [Digitaria exilis]